MEWKSEGGKLQQVFLLGWGKPHRSAGACAFPCWQNLGDVKREWQAVQCTLSTQDVSILTEVVFGSVGTQLWPPISGPAAAWMVNWVFWGNTPLLSSVSGTDKNLSLSSTHVTALKEIGKISRGCQRSLYSLVLCLFVLWAFFTALPQLPQKLSTHENNLVIFLTSRNLGSIALFYSFLVGS